MERAWRSGEGTGMGFWLMVTGLAAIVALPLVLVLWRGREAAQPAPAYDLQVYRDQLAELDRDRARGILSQADADRARIEISRRILEADRELAASAPDDTAARRGDAMLAALVALVVIGGGLGLYAVLGVPGARDLPRAERLAALDAAHAERPSQAAAEAARGPEEETVPEGMDAEYLALVRQLRGLVAERPGDPEGNALLARHEAALGRFAAAHGAKAREIAAKADAATARDHAQLAEFMILAAGGYVSPEAEAALAASLSRNPAEPTARYYLGLMFAQAGRHDRAFEIWRGLLAEGPADAPWIAPVREQIPQVARLAGRRLDPALLAAEPEGGPTAADMAAAAEMTEADRAAMIRGMVSGLEARLGAEGGTPGDWARLIRALGVLGEHERAQSAWQEARAAFAGDYAALAALDGAAADAGVGQ